MDEHELAWLELFAQAMTKVKTAADRGEALALSGQENRALLAGLQLLRQHPQTEADGS